MPNRPHSPNMERPPLLDRRDLLRVGGISLAATALPLGAAPVGNAHARNIMPGVEGVSPTPKADRVIYLWLGGGMTQLESFDPKPQAPAEIRGELGGIDTRLPGVQFGECMPHMAAVADKIAVLRSYSHGSNDHLTSQAYTLSGRQVKRNELFSEPNLGSLVSRILGPRAGLPGYIAVPGVTRPADLNLFVGGWLGQQYAPFCIGGREVTDYRTFEKSENPSPVADEDLTPKELALPDEISLARLKSREHLRETFDQALVGAEQLAAMDGHYESALNLLTSSSVRGAFDLAEESPNTRERYGRTKIGGRCLMARRLVEAGARWVMVDYGYDPDYGNLWDNHCAPVQKQPHISKMCRRGYHLVGVDQALAALVSDLDERGLLDRTLVVLLTEFGRTPKINARGGRDHWGAAGSLCFAGAGIQRGIVVGETDKQAGAPITRGYTPGDVAATIFELLGLRQARVINQENRPKPVLDHGMPIPELLS